MKQMEGQKFFRGLIVVLGGLAMLSLLVALLALLPTPSRPPDPTMGGGPGRIRNSIGMEFVLVQAGTFQMGSNDDNREKPIHSVTITCPFSIGKYEVTQKQWQAVMGTSSSSSEGDNRPVNLISWNDVQDFIRKLNEKEGSNKYRLPSEAEWEFVARGGILSKGFKFSGANELSAVAVSVMNSGLETQEVGSKKANELGIYDMSGNVWEWCGDWYGDFGALAQRDPVGPPLGEWRVLRGGSFGNDNNSSRVAYRNYDNPNSRDVS